MIVAMKPSSSQAVRVGGVAGVILAGGQGRRLFPGGDGDKALVPLAGKPLIAHAAARFGPQVFACAISTNSKAQALRRFAMPLLADAIGGPRAIGPLAGILTAMEWAKQAAPYCAWLASMPVDAPFVPLDLVARLAGQMQADEHEVVVVRARRRVHFVTALWSLNLAPKLRRAITEGGMRKVEDFLVAHRTGYLDWPVRGADPFLNINTPQDLARATARLNPPRPVRGSPRRR